MRPLVERLRGRPGVLATAALSCVVTAVFWDAFVGGLVFFERDVHGFWYPMTEAFVRCVAEGAWPVWHPWEGFGVPMLANPAHQVAYPLTWLNLILLPATYYKLFVFVHCVFGGCGLFVLSRRLGLQPLAAFTAAAIWTASGPLLSSVNLFHHFAGAVWLPWVIGSLKHALERGRPGPTLIAGAFWAGQLLAGSADMVFMGCLMGVAVVVAHLSQRDGPLGPRLRGAILVVAPAGAFAALLASAQWLPTLDLVSSGSRLSFEARTNLYWSVHPASLLDLVIPGLVSDLPWNAGLRDVLLEAREPLLRILYLGVGSAALVGLSLARSTTGSRAVLGGGFFFLLCSLGPHTPLMPLLLKLPVFGIFRYPSKYLITASLLWALLAGFGMEVWLSRLSPRARRGLALVAGAMAVLGAVSFAGAGWLGRHHATLGELLRPATDTVSVAANAASSLSFSGTIALGIAVLFILRWLRPTEPRRWLTSVTLLLVVGDLLAVGRHVNLLAPPELLTRRPPLLEAIAPEVEAPRLYVMGYPRDWLLENLGNAPPGWDESSKYALGQIEMAKPPTGGRWRLWGSFDGDFTGLASPAQALLSRGALHAQSSELLVRLLRMGAVDYVVALHDPGLPGLVEERAFPSVFREPIRLLRVADPQPRAYLVDRSLVAPEPTSFYVVGDAKFDPGREVVLPTKQRPLEPQAGFSGAARIVRRLADRVELDVVATAEGYLVLVEAFDAGWSATVDGRPTEVLRANVLFRGVRVPPGRHSVVFEYRPPSVILGLLLSALGLALGLAFWLRNRSSSYSGRA